MKTNDRILRDLLLTAWTKDKFLESCLTGIPVVIGLSPIIKEHVDNRDFLVGFKEFWKSLDFGYCENGSIPKWKERNMPKRFIVTDNIKVCSLIGKSKEYRLFLENKEHIGDNNLVWKCRKFYSGKSFWNETNQMVAFFRKTGLWDIQGPRFLFPEVVDTKFAERHKSLVKAIYESTGGSPDEYDEWVSVHSSTGGEAECYWFGRKQSDGFYDGKTLSGMSPPELLVVCENKRMTGAFYGNRDVLLIVGKGWSIIPFLQKVEWVKNIPCLYWGDMDKAGFAILSRLRGEFPHVRSFFMNKEILLKGGHLCGDDAPKTYSYEHLTVEEQACVSSLNGKRLEQEKLVSIITRLNVSELAKKGR